MGQHREHQRERDRDGHYLGDRLSEHPDDFQGKMDMAASSDQGSQGYLLVLKEP